MKFLKNYLSQVVSELKKVSWPDKKQTINKTALVLIVSLILILFISGIDSGLKSFMKFLLK